MFCELTAIEESIVKNMMLSKSHKEIAALLDKPVEDIAAIIAKITAGTGIITLQMKKDSVKKVRPEKVKPISIRKVAVKKPNVEKARTESLKEQVRRNREERQMIERQRDSDKRQMNGQYKTKKVDYSNKVMLRIDRTTYIYAERGKEEETKNEYLKLYRRPLDNIHPIK